MGGNKANGSKPVEGGLNLLTYIHTNGWYPFRTHLRYPDLFCWVSMFNAKCYTWKPNMSVSEHKQIEIINQINRGPKSRGGTLPKFQ